MEVINESLKNVAKSAELIRNYIELGPKGKGNENLLVHALELLIKTVDILSGEVD